MGIGDRDIVPGSITSDAGVPLTGGKGAPVTLAQAKSLGFNSTRGITIKDGQYIFDPSLAPERQGFQSVGMAKPGEVQMTPYYGDVTGAYRLTQSQYTAARASGNFTKAQLDIMRQNEINALVAQGSSPEEAAAKVDSTGGYGTSSGGAGGVAGSSVSGSLTGTGGPGTPEQQQARKSAYDFLYEQFNQYGLGGLVESIKGLVQENVSPSEFAIRLRQTEPYKKRFAANAQRIAKGLKAIDESTYLALEDQYQEIMRRYGLPETYYTRGEMGRQEGFEKFIANDISSAELEDRIMIAQDRVLKANPEVARALKEFYPDITNGDILAYTLDPQNAIKNIQRKVTAAEIGGAAMAQGLQTGLARAEELAAYGVDKTAAQQGFATVATVAPRGAQLAEFYKESPYTQATAEQEVFNLAGSAEAAQKRKKLTALETAKFSGQAGLGALARDRAGAL